MAPDRGRLGMLGVAVTVLAAVLWWQFGSPSSARLPATGSAASAQPEASKGRGGSRQVPTVALARLGREAVEPNDTGRDPFRLGSARPALGRGGRGAVAPPPMPVSPPIATAPVVPPGPPPPPPITLKFIALMVAKGAGTKIAMVTDGHGVYTGQEGAVIEGRYRIIRISSDSIDVAYLDGRGRRTIPLSGS